MGHIVDTEKLTLKIDVTGISDTMTGYGEVFFLMKIFRGFLLTESVWFIELLL